ncbi:hypothetical protein SADUNF_Sadunf19G0016800 [Salix dunnii]|uniref:Uncharacterized protein n=1 Tax=Salix dunnii TaxID=1413687 RepID=A0A835IXW1_9ROSI|nr:hypothetical protein SADUNF_Sadunf19G0016800 [Salix dunnii]
MNTPDAATAIEEHVMNATLITQMSTTVFSLVLWTTGGFIALTMDRLLLLSILFKPTLKKTFDEPSANLLAYFTGNFTFLQSPDTYSAPAQSLPFTVNSNVAFDGTGGSSRNAVQICPVVSTLSTQLQNKLSMAKVCWDFAAFVLEKIIIGRKKLKTQQNAISMSP